MFLQNIITSSREYDENNLRGSVKEWYIYYSDEPFSFSNENNVNKLTIDNSDIEYSQDANNMTTYTLDISSILNNKIYIRIGYKDSYEIESNISLLLLLTCAKEDSQDPGTTPSNIVPKYTLTASAGDGGSVSTLGGSYNKGTQVSITATASEGYRFTGWSNGSSDNPVTVTLNSNTSITANFEQIPVYSISVSAEEGGSVSSEGGDYSEGNRLL